MGRAVLYLVQKEFRQVFRDQAMLRIIFAVPILQLFVLSYAVTFDLKNIRFSFLDGDRTRESRSLVEAVDMSQPFVPGPPARTPRELRGKLEEGETDISLWIPKGFAEGMMRGEGVSVGLAVDGINTSIAGRALGYGQAIVVEEGFALSGAVGAAEVARATTGGSIAGVHRFFYNPELESRYHMVPAIVVLLITVVSMFLTGMAVVREKEIGTLEQLLVSPISPAQLIAGKTIPFVIIAYAEMAFALLVAALWFRLPMEGSILLLALCAFVFLLVTLGVGLFASTVSSTQQQAMFTIWFFLVFGILMSGFFFPIENMPVPAQWLTYLNPLRYMMRMVRGILLKGASFADLAGDFALLALLGTTIFGFAVGRFRKRIA
jgi:ABC-2 type transport system permease protein